MTQVSPQRLKVTSNRIIKVRNLKSCLYQELDEEDLMRSIYVEKNSNCDAFASAGKTDFGEILGGSAKLKGPVAQPWTTSAVVPLFLGQMKGWRPWPHLFRLGHSFTASRVYQSDVTGFFLNGFSASAGPSGANLNFSVPSPVKVARSQAL